MPEILSIILGVLCSILVIVLIVLGIKLIMSVHKVNLLLDDVQEKVDSVDGLFEVMDKFTDLLSGVSDRLVDVITLGLKKFFTKKNKREEKEEDDE